MMKRTKSVLFLILASRAGGRSVSGSTHPENNITNTNTCSIGQHDAYQDLPNGFPGQYAANTSDLFPMPKCYGVTIEEATIDQLQDHLRAGDITSEQLVTCYLQRTWQTNEYINAVLEVNPDAYEIAARLDAEREAGRVRSMLHGIPYMVKDNIATKDRMQTTAGSWALQGSIVPRDAHVVAKLRDAGALLLGKATLSEWADMRSNNYSEGYSARGGQCRSSYNLTVNPGGSSSGSAVGVAANAFTFSLGTETDGSIINPAERNAIVGLKPTVGLTSRAGVVPESLNQDSVGVFVKSVREAAYVLDAIYGIDEADNYTFAQAGRTPANGYVPSLTDRDALRKATFGIPWRSFWIHANPEQQEVLLQMIELIKDAGGLIVNNTELMDYELIVSPNGWDWDYGTTRGRPNESEYTYIKVDFYNNIKSYLAELNDMNIRTLEDIVAYNIENDGSEGGRPWPLGNPAFYSGQDGFLASLNSHGVQDETYWQALNFCRASTRERGIDHALSLAIAGQKLDALLAPADVGQSYQIAAQAGYPVITIPAGVSSLTGMPYGLALMQTAFEEGALLKWASAIEDLMKDTPFKRTLPMFHEHLRRNIPVVNE